MDIVEKAFRELFPEKDFYYNSRLRYSKAFNAYNANIKYFRSKNEIVVSLSYNWKEVSEEIMIGLIQELLMKMFGKNEKTHKRRTLSMDLYHIYLKNTHIVAEKDKIDPVLLESFKRVNERYFDGEIEQTNLIWGNESVRTLGRYEYGSDTIMISSIFKDGPDIFIDRVMHHEMLHKKHKYDVKNGRCTHHTKKFRDEERQFDDFDKVEKDIHRFVMSRRSTRSRSKTKGKGILGWLNDI